MEYIDNLLEGYGDTCSERLFWSRVKAIANKLDTTSSEGDIPYTACLMDTAKDLDVGLDWSVEVLIENLDVVMPNMEPIKADLNKLNQQTIDLLVIALQEKNAAQNMVKLLWQVVNTVASPQDLLVLNELLEPN